MHIKQQIKKLLTERNEFENLKLLLLKRENILAQEKNETNRN